MFPRRLWYSASSIPSFHDPQELMAVGEPKMRVALLKKAFISDWEGAAPPAVSEPK